MKNLSLLLLALLSLNIAFAGKKIPLKEKIEKAQKIYLITLPETPVISILHVKKPKSGETGKTIKAPSAFINNQDNIKAEFADAQMFADFNKKALAKFNEFFDGKVTLVPDEFTEEKQSYSGETYKKVNYKELDCDFYIVMKAGNPGTLREVKYIVYEENYKFNKKLISCGLFDINLTLYEKEDPNKKGQKRVWAGSSLIGKHKAIVGDSNKGGVFEQDGYKTDFFLWTNYTRDDMSVRESEFKKLNDAIKIVIPERLEETLNTFVEKYQKKVKK